MIQKYTIIIEQGLDGYLIGSVLELPGCRSQAKSHDQLMERLREAIEVSQPESSSWRAKTPNFVGIQNLEVHA